MLIPVTGRSLLSVGLPVPPVVGGATALLVAGAAVVAVAPVVGGETALVVVLVGAADANPPAVQALHEAGYDGTAHRAQGFDPDWFDDLDLVVALDRGHERVLRSWARTDAQRDKVVLLRSFDPDLDVARDGDEVADPYGQGPEVFAACRDQIEAACRGLVARLRSGVTLAG